MDRMTQTGIVVGVDTHRDVHVAVALDAIGGRLGQRSVPTTRAGYADLERWAAFHEMVGALPAEEREVVGLVHYHGWTQAQIAELFGVTERTVRRWWQSALLKLGEAMADHLPEA